MRSRSVHNFGTCVWWTASQWQNPEKNVFRRRKHLTVTHLLMVVDPPIFYLFPFFGVNPPSSSFRPDANKRYYWVYMLPEIDWLIFRTLLGAPKLTRAPKLTKALWLKLTKAPNLTKHQTRIENIANLQLSFFDLGKSQNVRRVDRSVR